MDFLYIKNVNLIKFYIEINTFLNCKLTLRKNKKIFATAQIFLFLRKVSFKEKDCVRRCKKCKNRT